MLSYKKTHPITILTKIFILVKTLFVPIILLLLTTYKQNYFHWVAIGISVIFCFLFFLIFMGWAKTKYALSTSTLEIEKGFLFHNKLSLPFDKIQAFHLTETFLSKFLPIIQVKIETAGNSSSTDITFLLSSKEARKIHSVVYPEQQDNTYEPPYIRRVTWKELLVLSVTSSNILIGLSTLYGIYTQIEDFFPELTHKFYQTISGSWLYIFMLIFIVILLSIFIIYAKYANFRLYNNEGNIIIEHGIFVSKKITIPINKIQAIVVEEGILQQFFGLASLEVESIGYGSENSQKAILFPLIKKKDISYFLQQLSIEVPISLDEKNIGWEKAPLRSCLRYINHNAVLYISLSFVWIFLFSYSSFLFIGLLVFMIWGVIQHRDTGIFIKEDFIFIQYRIVNKKTVFVSVLQIQSIDVDRDLWGKKKDLSTFEFYLASENSDRMFKLRHMDCFLESKVFQWYWKEIKNK